MKLWLVQAWEMYKTEKLELLVDPVMTGEEQAVREAVRFMKVGLLCVQEKCDRRPSISKALSLMSDINIEGINQQQLQDDLQLHQPGIITDIMDVKLGRSQQSSR